MSSHSVQSQLSLFGGRLLTRGEGDSSTSRAAVHRNRNIKRKRRRLFSRQATMASFGRALGVLRAGSRLVRRSPQRITTRKAGDGPHIEVQYRQYPQLTKSQKFQSEFISGVMWFWILWHCWHDGDAVLGHFPWPDASQWTDEELGIPADDEE